MIKDLFLFFLIDFSISAFIFFTLAAVDLEAYFIEIDSVFIISNSTSVIAQRSNKGSIFYISQLKFPKSSINASYIFDCPFFRRLYLLMI